MAHDWEIFLQETTHQNKAPLHLLTLLESKYYRSPALQLTHCKVRNSKIEKEIVAPMPEISVHDESKDHQDVSKDCDQS